MKKFKPLELFFMAILILAMCSCECVEDWVDDQNNDPIPYSQQAASCGGAADVFGLESTEDQDILYTDTSGQKVVYHRFIFTDSIGNQLFTIKYANYEFHPEGTQGFIVDYSDPNREDFLDLEIMQEVESPDDPNVTIGLCHQWKECPGINGDCNFAPNSYPGTPVDILYCNGDFEVGQHLGLVVVFPIT